MEKKEIDKLLQTLTKQFADIVKKENQVLKEKLDEIERKLILQQKTINELHASHNQTPVLQDRADNKVTRSETKKAGAENTGSYRYIKPNIKPPNSNIGNTYSAPIDDNRNPVQVLNELYMGLKYTIDRRGPDHRPIFKASVNINGKVFWGQGSNQKAAKEVTAATALRFLKRQSNTKAENNEDETLRGAVMTLNEMYPGTVYDIVEDNICPVNFRFGVTATVGREKFTGYASNKQTAKHNAATKALRQLDFNSRQKGWAKTLKAHVDEAQRRADHIGELIQSKFNSLMSGDLLHARRKVLAGIVMTYNGNLSEAQIICVTTGTKCISGEFLSIQGSALNDMHAEIISRRCLMNYLYDQLELITTSEADNSIFMLRQDGKGYKLRKGFEFHLYISTAPCGDARIFSPHENGDAVDKHPAGKSKGVLRTKIENGEGSIPVPAKAKQTWDGILHGNKLLTMTCSDKICLWNVVGLQGALLSHFIEPIYLKSVVLGSLLNEFHLKRALYGRIENSLQQKLLPSSFDLNRPSMHQLTTVESREAANSTDFSVVWCTGIGKPEIIHASSGKPDLDASRFSKMELAKRFVGLVGRRISSITDIGFHIPRLYGEAKGAAHAYQEAKRNVLRAFEENGLGNWICKPMEQDQFMIYGGEIRRNR